MGELRKSGNWGQISVPANSGVAVSNAALTPSSSKTIGQKTYTDRFCGHASTHWNTDSDASTPISVRLQGIIGEASITPHASADKIATSAFSIYKDNGAIVTVAADTDVSLTRPAGAVAKWNAIVVDSSGSVTAVAGTDSADTTLLETFGASAGQIPYTPVDSFLIGLVKLSGNTAAVVAASDIFYSLTDGTLIQERSDFPSYEIMPLAGGVLLERKLPKCHTAGVARKVYASFMSQASALAPIAHTTDWKLTMSHSTTTMPAQGDVGTHADFSAPPSFTGSFAKYAVGFALPKAVMGSGKGYVRLYPDRNLTAEYYEAAVIYSGFDTGASQGSPIKDSLSFQVDGVVEIRES